MRTTNDVKGWHTHLANHAGLSISSKGLNLYILLKFLYEEVIQVDIYTKMLAQFGAEFVVRSPRTLLAKVGVGALGRRGSVACAWHCCQSTTYAMR